MISSSSSFDQVLLKNGDVDYREDRPAKRHLHRHIKRRLCGRDARSKDKPNQASEVQLEVRQRRKMRTKW